MRRLADQVPGTRPRSTTWRSSSLWGLSRTGFIFTDQGAPQALLSRWSAPRCGAALRRIAFVTATKRVQRILTHLGEPAKLPRSAPARGPPALDTPLEPLPNRDSEAQPDNARVSGGTGRTRWVSRGLMRHAPVANVRLPPDCCHRALRDGCPLWVGKRSPTGSTASVNAQLLWEVASDVKFRHRLQGSRGVGADLFASLRGGKSVHR